MHFRILVALSVCAALVSGASLLSNVTSASESNGGNSTDREESHPHSHNITSQFVHDFIKNFNKSDAVNATLKGVNATDVKKSNSSADLKTRDVDAAAKRLNTSDNSTSAGSSSSNGSTQVDDFKVRPVEGIKLANLTGQKNASLDNSTQSVDSTEQVRRAVSDKVNGVDDDLRPVSNATLSKSAVNTTQLNATETNKTVRAAGDDKPNVKISLFHLPSFADLTFVKSNASALNDSLSLNTTGASNSTNSTVRELRQTTVVDFLTLDDEDDSDAKSQNGTEVAKNGTEDATKEESLDDMLGDFV